MEQLMGRRNLLLTKREDLQKKIRELGSLPSNAFDKYKGKGMKVRRRPGDEGAEEAWFLLRGDEGAEEAWFVLTAPFDFQRDVEWSSGK
eukprot:9264128-Pyramimonas_sp.AAC.2